MAWVLWAWLGGSCGPAADPAHPGTNAAPAVEAPEAPQAASTGDNKPHPSYLGGPVLQNAAVVLVYWNGNVRSKPELESFYRTITRSAVFSALAEYATSNPRQSIGLGSLVASIAAAGSQANLVHNADIQRELSRLISVGAVPSRDRDTLYMIHFPPDVSVEFDQGLSCVDFCGYHTTFQRNGANVYYAVIPDMSGRCAGACGPSDDWGNTTAVASHELVESVTDPAVGLAADLGPPLGWFDRDAGEIADICNGQRATVEGFTIQPAWSNALNRCFTF